MWEKPGNFGSIINFADAMKCAIKSFGASSPTAYRMVVGLIPASAWALSSNSECVVKADHVIEGRREAVEESLKGAIGSGGQRAS